MRTNEVRSVRWSEAHGDAITPRAENGKSGEVRTIVLEGLLYAFPVEAPDFSRGSSRLQRLRRVMFILSSRFSAGRLVVAFAFCFRRLPKADCRRSPSKDPAFAVVVLFPLRPERSKGSTVLHSVSSVPPW